MTRSLLVLVLLGAALVGCGGGKRESPSAAEPVEQEKVVATTADDCGEGSPITHERALETLRDAGFSMTSDAQCSLTNSGKRNDEKLAREGIVFCLVRDHAPPGAPETTLRRGVDGADAELVLRNLECTIFTDSPTGETKIQRLEAAFAELARSIGP